MAQQVLEGTWEEIARHAEELKLNGRQVKLIVTDEPAPLPVDEKQAGAIAYFEARLKAAQNASPEEMARGEQEVAELMLNLNENRIAAGERPLFPE